MAKFRFHWILLTAMCCFFLPNRISGGCITDRAFHGYSFFNPELANVQSPYAPFFLHFDRFYDRYFPDSLVRNENLLEWKQKFCNYALPEDVEYVVYKAPAEEMERLLTIVRSKNLHPDGRLSGNTFAEVLFENKCTEAIQYLLFAKRCEPHVLPFDPWEKPRRDVPAMQALIEEGRSQFLEVRSPFLRLRYAYQLIRLAHYSGRYQQVLDLHDYLMPKVDSRVKSIVRYWIMGHRAGALQQLGRRVEAAYLYALVFLNDDGKRESAFRSFDIRTDEEWKQCLLLCQNDREIATLYILRANADDSRAAAEMARVYELDPRNEQLELLLVKEIKELERDLLGYEFNDHKLHNREQFDLPRKKAGEYLVVLHKLVRRIVREGKIPHPDLWKVADGYLELLGGDYYAATLSFAKLKDQLKDTRLKAQVELFELAARVAAYKTVSRDMEEDLFDIRRNNPIYADNAAFKDFLRDKLAFLYKKAGAKGKAFRVHYSVAQLAMNPQLDIIEDLLDLCDKDDPSRLETSFVTDRDGTSILYQLLDMKGTLYLMENKLEAALEVFKQIPVTEREQVYNPFYLDIRDCVNCPAPEKAERYDKAELIEKLLELQYQARAALDEGGLYYYQLGVAYYNMTYFGNTWRALDYFRSGTSWQGLARGDVFQYPNAPYGNREMTDCSVALDYFKKAIVAGKKDPELAARAAFMAAKCQQKQYFCSPACTYKPAANRIPLLPDASYAYFRMLRSEFSNTAFYQQAIKECKYFKAFAAK